MDIFIHIYICIPLYMYIDTNICVHIYIHIYIYVHIHMYMNLYAYIHILNKHIDMGRLRLVGSLKLWGFFAKEPCKKDNILQKRPMILSILNKHIDIKTSFRILLQVFVGFN